MTRRPVELALLACSGLVHTHRDNRVPPMFARVTRHEDNPRGRRVYVGDDTWLALVADGRAMVAFERAAAAASPGGLALAGPPFDAAAARRGLQRQLRAA